jgi:hypothetical protein
MAEEPAFGDGAARVPPYDEGRVAGDRGFLPATPPRARAESVAVRLIATAGVVGIGTAIGAIMGAYDVAGWIVGLVASAVSVVLAAVLWRSRRL